ncbi:hypothetical protein DPMN_149843 [Dreissena polymorpha]|uniref:Uncharacterized protein n=1 Tax=Dreissena polymorpha TaxID=45954 RepID=A0A9D4FGS6_DREPO|nr:hypothetical protein DPMN_149843 [Dreissena polymorpha]
MDMETYMTSAICTEHTEVLVFERKHYERLFVKKHQRTIDVMRRRLEVKLNTRTSVLKVLVPLRTGQRFRNLSLPRRQCEVGKLFLLRNSRFG